MMPSEDALRRDVFGQMSTIVLRLSTGKRDVGVALGMSFSRIRVLRRVAAHGPLPMRDLVTLLNTDAPNVTVAVDDLEAQGLVNRTPHPTDRRSKMVEATRAGRRAARKANAILSRPPAGFDRLDAAELAELHRVLAIVLDGESVAGF